MKATLTKKEVFELFWKPGEVVEVRILKVYGNSSAYSGFARGTVSGYFDDYEAFCKCVKAVDKIKHGGVYFTLQMIDPRLIGRAFNRLKAADVTTSDQNVIAYRWLPVDLDPVRPSGIASSSPELAKAMKLREEVAKWVTSELKFSDPIKAMSGNGAHLLFRLPDMQVNDSTGSFIKNTLAGLADRFNTADVTIDQSVFNPARIWKLYGTTARKGDEVPAGPQRAARPHRTAYIDDLGGHG